MKTFRPKMYLDGKITKENCNHEILINFDYDEQNYYCDCVICGTTVTCSHWVQNNRYIFFPMYESITLHQMYTLQKLLTIVSKKHIYHEKIDIVDIFEGMAVVNVLNQGEYFDKTGISDVNIDDQPYMHYQKSNKLIN